MANEQTYIDMHESFRSGPGAGAPQWLEAIRKNGIDAFARAGFPDLKNESWRFTRLRPLLQHDFAIAKQPAADGLDVQRLQDLTFLDGDCRRLVFVDGHYTESLSNPGVPHEGVRISSLAAALEDDEDLVRSALAKHAETDARAFTALNTAHVRDGAFVHVSKGVELREPVHLIYVASTAQAATHPRNLVIVEENARAVVVESYVSTGDDVYFTNAVSEFVVAGNADVKHYKVQKESREAYHIAYTTAHIGGSGRFSTEFVSLGGTLVRNDVNTVLDGEGIDATLNGLYVANGHQSVDNHTNIEHAKPHCDSHELYKGILAGRARGVFNGKIHVHPDAQKTDAKQSNGAMLLSDDAQINTNPQLEIYADDVKCTHGAVVGQIEEKSVFYLRSRGIPERDARHMLVFAFANDVLERIQVGPLRERLESDLANWLDEAQPVGPEA